MNWFYESGGKQQGPISDDALNDLLARGEITPETLVWREGMETWTPLGQARAASAPVPEPEPAPPAAPPGTVKCDACGKFFPPHEVAVIGNRNICTTCKPAVLQSVQAGGALPSAAEGERTGPPWERRGDLGFVQASVQTIKEVLLQPGEFFTRMRRSGGLVAPLLFYLIFGFIGVAATIAYQWVFQMLGFAVGGLTGSDSEEFSAVMGIGYTTFMVIYLLLMPVLLALGAFIYAGILHLCLMICGGANQSFETTFRVYCYGTGATSLWMVVPFCGGIIAWVWSIVATIFGLWKAHDTTVGRAVLAVFLPLILCIGLAIVAVIAAIAIPAAVGAGAAGN